MHLSKDIVPILQQHAVGQTLLKVRVLDHVTRATLSDVLANHMIVKYNGRYVALNYFLFKM